jgi:hypothetical protein
MDDQITQLDRRLISVEKDVAILTAESEHARLHYATKEDLARVEGRVAVIQSNYATKEDVAELRTEIGAVELRLTTKIADLEGKFLSMENRYLRWTVGAIVAVAGIVLVIVRTFP